MNVLVWSSNQILSDLVMRNLAHRGFAVRELPALWTGDPLRSVSNLDGGRPDLVIVDLDNQEPELWQYAERVRSMMPCVPLVFLGHAWPSAPQLDRLQPCAYVRKPFAIDTLLEAVQHVTMLVGAVL
ncbi:MAG: hypothetical protein AB7P40_20360 [Chloroflexota bacterium]